LTVPTRFLGNSFKVDNDVGTNGVGVANEKLDFFEIKDFAVFSRTWSKDYQPEHASRVSKNDPVGAGRERLDQAGLTDRV